MYTVKYVFLFYFFELLQVLFLFLDCFLYKIQYEEKVYLPINW